MRGASEHGWEGLVVRDNLPATSQRGPGGPSQRDGLAHRLAVLSGPQSGLRREPRPHPRLDWGRRNTRFPGR